MYTSFEDRYNALSVSIISAIQSVLTISTNNELDVYMGNVETVSEYIVSCETRARGEHEQLGHLLLLYMSTHSLNMKYAPKATINKAMVHKIHFSTRKLPLDHILIWKEGL